MNKDVECKGCEYNTPRTKGGKGRICSGRIQMGNNRTRCPEWRINELQSELSQAHPPTS